MRSVLSRYSLAAAIAAVLGVGIADASAADIPAQAEVAIPSAHLLGKPLGSTKAFGEKPAEAIYPESLQFDLDGQLVYGFIAKYPEQVKFDDLVEAVNRTHRKWWRDPKREMAKFGVTVWRNEKERCSIQVADSQIIMIWLDRRVTDRETEEIHAALMQGLIEQAAKSAESAGKDPDDNSQ